MFNPSGFGAVIIGHAFKFVIILHLVLSACTYDGISLGFLTLIIGWIWKLS